MKSLFKKSVALVLALIMLCGTFATANAAELNEEAISKHYGQYKNYVLLGDSAASGYRDVMSDEDDVHNKMYNQSTYCRYPGSYSDIIANSIIEDKSMTALAAPGFRTIEMRYMLEDDFAAVCDDEYLFHPSQLYVYENQVCECCGLNMTPGSEHFRKQFKESIANADLITLGIGGNDWGAYLSWVITDLFERENIGDEFMAKVEDILANNETNLETVEKLVEIAHVAGALPALLTEIPSALNYGLENFYKNWDIMIQDIYDLNPDVTIAVVSMSDNSLKGNYYSYNGVEGAPVIAEGEEPSELETIAMTTIVDFIMSVGNKPMIDGAEKFGYIYVDTAGTTYVDSHPDSEGHKFIANKIIEALPDPVISKQFDDVKPGNKYYNSVEYVVSKGIMSPVTETTFCPDKALTEGDLNKALNAIVGTEKNTDSTSEVNIFKLAISFLTASFKKDFAGMFKGIAYSFGILADNIMKLGATVSRAEAAEYFKNFNEI